MSIARSTDAAKEYIEKWYNRYGFPNFISFDHDLGENDTSMFFIHWMINRVLDGDMILPKDFTFNVHSANPVGKKNIEGLMNSFLKSLDKN